MRKEGREGEAESVVCGTRKRGEMRKRKEGKVVLCRVELHFFLFFLSLYNDT